MTFVSLFAGVGGFDLGFERSGHECVGQCEIDPHARRVLDARWPAVPKHDDVTTLTASTFEHPDVVTFGSPCQDLSVAGKRAGLAGGRSGLFLEAVRYIREIQEETNGRLPRFAVWENVPGAFSSNDGHDFAAVLESLVGGTVGRPADGWRNAGVAFGPRAAAAWRVLDSQFFGVPQRRRRVFLVTDFGGERAGSVLLESEGVRRDSPKGRTPGQGITGALTGGPGSSSAGNVDDNRAQAGFVIPTSFNWQAAPAQGFMVDEDKAGPLDTSQTKAVAFDLAQITSPQNRTRVAPGLPASTLSASSSMHTASSRSVRRLTPRECERLQGFPDDHTRWDAHGSEIADTHRYRMMGNAVTVNVAQWIGRRLHA